MPSHPNARLEPMDADVLSSWENGGLLLEGLQR
jgi:hypothetical protein